MTGFQLQHCIKGIKNLQTGEEAYCHYSVGRASGQKEEENEQCQRDQPNQHPVGIPEVK